MTQYNSLNVKLSNSQRNKLKSAIKIKTERIIKYNSSDKTNIPYELLLTNRQVANLCKAFANNSSTDFKLSKTQLSQMMHSRGFLGRILLFPLLKTGLPPMKNAFKSLAKSVLISLGLTAAATAADSSIHKKNLRIW